jgi:hypothetical protein
MEIIDKSITHQNLKGLKNMSTTLKIQDWEKSYSEMRKMFCDFKTDELETLSDAYVVMAASMFKLQIKAIKDELELRKTSLGKELM